MRFDSIGQIRDVLMSGRHSTPLTDAILDWINNHTKLWIVTTEISVAVVYGKHESDAMEAAGFRPNSLKRRQGDVTCLEIDPDSPTRFYEDKSRKSCIVNKDEDDYIG